MRGDEVTLPGVFFHYLHHRYFECNYGDTLVPLDRWFGTFHDGTPEAHAHMKKRWDAGFQSENETS